MKDIANNISQLVQTQFPDFYNQEGPVFIQFIKAYYEWMEETGNTLYYSRRLDETRDIDNTLDEFLVHFREKYLAQLQATSRADQREFIKHVKDLYRSKGSTQGFKLLFRLLFDEPVDIYHPGVDVLKPSDAAWFEPFYLELSATGRAKNFVGKEVQGSSSGAMAFAEKVIRRLINGRYIDILYVSNIRGAFKTGELVVEDGILKNAPIVIGSLNDIVLTTGGANNTIGDIFDVVSADGVEGQVRVTAVNSQTGLVEFALINGGYGFTSDANTLTQVSVNVLTIANSDPGTYLRFETVTQSGSGATANVMFANSTKICIFANTGVFLNGSGEQITGSDSAIVANVTSVSTGAGADFEIGTPLGNPETVTLYTDILNDKNSGNVLYTDIALDGSNSNVGFVDTINVTDGGTLYDNADTVVFTGGTPTTGATGTVITDGGGIVQSITVDTGGTGYDSAPVVTITTGTGSSFTGTANMDFGYGLPGDVNADIDSIIDSALTTAVFTIGTIASLTGLNPGSGYNENPCNLAYHGFVAEYNKRDFNIEIANTTGTFAVGELLQQSIPVTTALLTFSGNSIPFTDGEGVTQAGSNAHGEILSSNTTILTVRPLNSNAFDANVAMDIIVGALSGADANVDLSTGGSTTDFAKGIVTSIPDATHLKAKRTSFSANFNTSVLINGATSGATANIISVTNDSSTDAMGDNANVTSVTAAATGVATAVEMIDSGFGYIANGAITLTSDNSPFVMAGTAVLIREGMGKGFWKNSNSFLSHDKYIHDNNFYQEYSYQVKASTSLDKYEKIVKDLLHVSGTKLFGTVIKENTASLTLASNSEITQA